MAERDPLYLQAGSYEAAEDRLGLAAIFGSRHFVDLAPSTSPLVSAGGGHGVVGAGDMLVTGDGAGMDVTVAAGLALVRGTQQGDQGVYVTSNDAAKTLTVSTADATNPRKDLVVTRVKDAEYGIAGDTGPLEVVAGTPTGGLTAGNVTGRPTPPENALILAEVLVPAGVTSNASFTITDLRTRASALGGIMVCTSTTRPNPAYAGQVVYEAGRLLAYDGAAWVVPGPMYAYKSGDANTSMAPAQNQTFNMSNLTIPFDGVLMCWGEFQFDQTAGYGGVQAVDINWQVPLGLDFRERFDAEGGEFEVVTIAASCSAPVVAGTLQTSVNVQIGTGPSGMQLHNFTVHYMLLPTGTKMTGSD